MLATLPIFGRLDLEERTATQAISKASVHRKTLAMLKASAWIATRLVKPAERRSANVIQRRCVLKETIGALKTCSSLLPISAESPVENATLRNTAVVSLPTVLATTSIQARTFADFLEATAIMRKNAQVIRSTVLATCLNPKVSCAGNFKVNAILKIVAMASLWRVLRINFALKAGSAGHRETSAIDQKCAVVYLPVVPPMNSIQPERYVAIPLITAISRNDATANPKNVLPMNTLLRACSVD
ncbi:MAG: hypothetical protein BVN35_17810 [Proteobacteria bacterium ST_bin11]|nr:MAG: hypothetical protein BVN35_17810 [Proteobacteria bacterium ST_bin11]